MAKILLVEDDNNLREIYAARLQAEGYTIVSANDGEEALVVAKAEKPDLVISDVMMPKISGFEMLDILRNTEGIKNVKVIMLTALGQNDDQQRASKLGADRYLVKSQVTLEDIVRVTHELLNDQPQAAAAAPAESANPGPSTEPAPDPPAATEPVVEEPVVPEPAAPQDAPPAQSEAQEEASVDAKIEDFVAGATEEASAPTPEPAAAPEPSTSPAPAAADDNLINDAVQTLNNSVAEPVTDDADSQAAASPAPTPTQEPVKPEATSSDTSSETMTHNKVIEPIDSPPKKDIQELVKQEEAEETGTVPGAAVSPSESQTAEGDDNTDPHTIAL